MPRLLTPARTIATLIAAGLAAPVLAVPTAGSEYDTDEQNEYVQDQTTERINTVNMIMCFMNALRPDAMVNEGNYVALADKNICDQNSRSSAANAGSSSSGSSSNYMRAVVNSSRASNSDPMRVKVWFENSDSGMSMDIYINLLIAAAPSASAPYGVFGMNYCGKDATGGIPGCLMSGHLESGGSGISFYEGENGTRTTQLLLSGSAGTSGSGAVRTVDGATVDAAVFAYDSTHFYRGDGSTNYCFDREKDNADASVWRYGLYTSAGARFDLDSGFPIKYTASDNTVYQGFMGYYGLFLPDAAGVANGDTIVKQPMGSGTETNYTLKKLGGRLTRYTQVARTLADIHKVSFTTGAWAFPSVPFATFNTVAGKTLSQAQAAGDQIELYWDDAAGKFMAAGLVSCGGGGCYPTRFPAPEMVDNAVFTGTLARGIQGYAQALGGEVFVNLNSSAPAAGTQVVTREQSLVYPDDYPATLYCVSNCPKGALLTLSNLQAGNLFYSGNGFSWQAAQLRTYTFAGDVLQDPDSGSVVSTVPSSSLGGTPYQWGVRSGILAAAADLSGGTGQLACDPSAPSGPFCADKINALTSYYVWETGSNNWNQFTALYDGNGYVHFDPPVNVNFNVPNTSAYGSYAGTTVTLQYGGFGNLWGIPGTCVSSVTNLPVDCGPGSDVRYVPNFTVPYDRTVGIVTDGGTSYWVKWLDRELRLAKVANGNCSGLTLPSVGSLSLPTSADVVDPSDPANTAVYIGTKPALQSAPAVIHGVVQ